jgi:hypothetical protein
MAILLSIGLAHRRPVAAFQVIYMFAEIVTGKDLLHYPEPAATFNNWLALASLRVFSLAPPECTGHILKIRTQGGFYARLVVSTMAPIFSVPFIFAYFRLFTSPQKINKTRHAFVNTIANSLAFFELVLSSVSTTVLQTVSACVGASALVIDSS